MGHGDPPVRHHDHQIPQAQFEARVPADTQNDNLPIEMSSFEEIFYRHEPLHLFIVARRRGVCTRAFGSLLIQTGASLAYVRDQMGHSSIQVTVDIYGHLIPSANISYVDKLDVLTTRQQSAIQPQQKIERKSEDFQEVLKNVWLGGRDLNPDTQIQSLQSYH
jgi:hypothetical protein